MPKAPTGRRLGNKQRAHSQRARRKTTSHGAKENVTYQGKIWDEAYLDLFPVHRVSISLVAVNSMCRDVQFFPTAFRFSAGFHLLYRVMNGQRHTICGVDRSLRSEGR